jgi:hypothetical protein
MARKIGGLGVLACICIPVFMACATTRQVKVWKDDSYQGKIQKVLVIGTSQVPLMRGFFENEFVDQLQSRGVEGVPSNTIIPPEKMRDKEAVLSSIKGMGIEMVIVTRLLGQEYIDQVYGGGVELVPTDYYGGWDLVWNQTFAAVPFPTYQYTGRVMVFQTNVYDLRQKKLIFSAVSKTDVQGAKESMVKPLIELVMKELAEKKLL